MSPSQMQQRLLEDLLEDDDARTSLELFSVVMSNLLLFFLIFGLSATVQVRQLQHQLTNKFAIFTGVAMQFIIMPVLGFIAVLLLRDSGFTQAMGICLLVVTASPGGSYSNWWCSLFNAELALSVAMTSVSSILSIGLLPANLFFYTWLAYTVLGNGEEVDIIESLDFGAIFISLGVVMAAILLGLYCGYRWDNATFHKRANMFGSVCGISLILFSIFLGSGGGGDTDANFWSFDWSFYVGVAFPCVVGMALANVIARSAKLSRPETVAISVECCYQNTAIATSVAVTMFKDPTERAEAISVPLFYGIVEAIIIGFYCVWAWKAGWTKAPSNEKICVVMTKTYEVNNDEEDEEGFDVEHGHQDLEPKSWWAMLFEPRVHEHHHDDDEVPQTPDKKSIGRDRFESVDVTVATASPPATPESSLEATPQMNRDFSTESADFSDLEPPEMRPSKESIEVPLESHEESLEDQSHEAFEDERPLYPIGTLDSLLQAAEDEKQALEALVQSSKATAEE
jgi:predicted Na+-dependent transporter